METLIWVATGALAGWSAGKLMKGRDYGWMGNIILGLIGTIMGIAGAIVLIPLNLGPAWYPIALVVLGLPCVWLGGKLRTRKA